MLYHQFLIKLSKDIQKQTFSLHYFALLVVHPIKYIILMQVI